MSRIDSRSSYLAAIVVSVLFLTLSPVGAIHVEPSYIDVRLDSGRPSGTFTLSNTSDVEERFRVNALYFEFTKTGGIKMSRTGDRSLASWIRFNPREVTLPPGTSRRVRFTILTRGTLAPGEYWGAMELENLNIQTMTSDPNADPNTETSIDVKVTSALLVPVFGTVGTVEYNGQLRAARVVSVQGKPRMDILFESKSSGRLGLAGDFRVEDAAGRVLAEGTCAQGYVLAGKQRIFSREIKEEIPPGKYSLVINARAVHVTEPFTLRQTIQWPPPELVVPTAKEKVVSKPPPAPQQAGSAATTQGSQ